MFALFDPCFIHACMKTRKTLVVKSYLWIIWTWSKSQKCSFSLSSTGIVFGERGSGWVGIQRSWKSLYQLPDRPRTWINRSPGSVKSCWNITPPRQIFPAMIERCQHHATKDDKRIHLRLTRKHSHVYTLIWFILRFICIYYIYIYIMYIFQALSRRMSSPFCSLFFGGLLPFTFINLPKKTESL